MTYSSIIYMGGTYMGGLPASTGETTLLGFNCRYPFNSEYPYDIYCVPFSSLNSEELVEGIDLTTETEWQFLLGNEFKPYISELTTGNHIGMYSDSGTGSNSTYSEMGFLERYIKNLFDELFILDEKLLYYKGIMNTDQLPGRFSYLYEKTGYDVRTFITLCQVELWKNSGSLLGLVALLNANDTVAGIQEFNMIYTCKIGTGFFYFDVPAQAIRFYNPAEGETVTSNNSMSTAFRYFNYDNAEMLTRATAAQDIVVSSEGYYYIYLDFEDGAIKAVIEPFTNQYALQDIFSVFARQMREKRTQPYCLMKIELMTATPAPYYLPTLVMPFIGGRPGSRSYDIWKSNTDYKYGDMIKQLDSGQTKTYWMCVKGGTSGVVVPTADDTVSSIPIVEPVSGVEWLNVGTFLQNQSFLYSYETKSRGGIVYADKNTEKVKSLIGEIFETAFGLDSLLFSGYMSSIWESQKNYNSGAVVTNQYNVGGVIHNGFFTALNSGKSAKTKPCFQYKGDSKRILAATAYNQGDVVYSLGTDNIWWVCINSATTGGLPAIVNTSIGSLMRSGSLIMMCLGDMPLQMPDIRNERQPLTRYVAGDIIVASSASSAVEQSYYYLCTQSGLTSSNPAGTFSGIIGTTATDGTVIWQNLGATLPTTFDWSNIVIWEYQNSNFTYKQHEN